jgi:hypothetical protein
VLASKEAKIVSLNMLLWKEDDVKSAMDVSTAQKVFISRIYKREGSWSIAELGHAVRST